MQAWPPTAADVTQPPSDIPVQPSTADSKKPKREKGLQPYPPGVFTKFGPRLDVEGLVLQPTENRALRHTVKVLCSDVERMENNAGHT